MSPGSLTLCWAIWFNCGVAFDLYSIDYLKSGSARQRRAYEALSETGVLVKIASWGGEEIGLGEAPALAGSLPLDLAFEDSDIDVVTYAPDLKSFAGILRREFGEHENFQSQRGISLGVATLMTTFRFGGESFEIFSQNILVPQQNAIIHLLVEERLLNLGDVAFREKILEARRRGLKTELAFGEVLGLEDPYRELLTFEELSDNELRIRFAGKL